MRHKQFTYLCNQDEQRVLATLVNCLPQSQTRAERLLICQVIKELVTPKGKHRQARSRNQIEQIRKKRFATLKQKTKKIMKRVSNVVFPIATHIFTRLVVETMIRVVGRWG